MGKHRATVFTRKADRASRYIVRPSWLAEQPSWPCRKFLTGMACFLAVLGATVISGQVRVVPADAAVPVPAAYVAPVVATGCAR